MNITKRKLRFLNKKEYAALPAEVQTEFGKALRYIQYDETPHLEIKHLKGMTGAIELIINGSPAYRCVYTTKISGEVVVIHSFVKTASGMDKAAMALTKERLKSI